MPRQRPRTDTQSKAGNLREIFLALYTLLVEPRLGRWLSTLRGRILGAASGLDSVSSFERSAAVSSLGLQAEIALAWQIVGSHSCGHRLRPQPT